MRLINAAEIVVLEQINKILRQKEGVCKCERCRLDIDAVALNNLAPNYVVSTEGEVVRSVSQQPRIDAQRQLEYAIRLVSERPHHM